MPNAIVAGPTNLISFGAHNFIGNGFTNKINTINTSNYNSILNGCRNCIDTSLPAIVGLQLCGGNTISGGYTNLIAAQETNSFIGAGRCNCIQTTGNEFNSGNNSMLSAYQSCIIGQTWGSTMVSAHNGCICNGFNAFIGGGDYNCIVGPAPGNPVVHSSILGGQCHRPYSSCAAIVGGDCNRICLGSPGSTIGGGCCNMICSTSNYSFIGGGRNNTTSGCLTTIGGGIHSIFGGAFLSDHLY